MSSASLSTMSGMADATAGIILDPYREYKRHRSMSDPEGTLTTDSQTGNPNHTRQMILLSITSLGKFLGRVSRGALLGVPLAATEGMRSLLHLYGGPVRDHNPITSFETGAAVAWSTFMYGVYEGVTDIFVHTYRAKKDQGAVGVAKGLMKGLVSLTVKTGSATMGLVAYPSQGAYRGLRRGLRKGVEGRVGEGRWVEGEVLIRKDLFDADRACMFFMRSCVRGRYSVSPPSFMSLHIVQSGTALI